MNHSGNAVGVVQTDGETQSGRQIDSETPNRLWLMQMELVEATNTAQLLRQVKELKQERQSCDIISNGLSFKRTPISEVAAGQPEIQHRFGSGIGFRRFFSLFRFGMNLD